MAFNCEIKGKLEYLTSDLIGLPHCFSTRLGGVSTGELSSLNLGLGRGDSVENVMENYRILGNAVGFSLEDLVFARQTHTDIVRVVTAENAGEGLYRPVASECDGLVTNVPGVALTVFTADCTPILLWDTETGAVGAVHAGWRGTVADIVGKAVGAMRECYGSKPADIRGAIGPNIGKCCFETDEDVPHAVEQLLGQEADRFILRRGGKFHVDLKGVNRYLLNRAGVESVDVSEACTACRPDRFWSHRVVGQKRGSMAAIIVCKGDIRT